MVSFTILVVAGSALMTEFRIRVTTVNTQLDLDNISVTEAIADRSVAGNHAQVVGTLTKTPVAPGAELMAFSGFSTSNYAKIPYSSDFDFGTGSFYFSCWVKGTDGYGRFISNRFTSAGVALLTSSNKARLISYGTPVESVSLINTNKWVKVDGLRRSDGTLEIYVNGNLEATGTNSSNVNNSSDMYLGITPAIADSYTGDISLPKVSATAPTAEQVKADYLAELPMFQANARVTLSGASDNVRALDYDKQTGLATVLTDVVDVFDELVNVQQGALVGSATCVSVGAGVTAIGTDQQVTIDKPEISLRDELAKIPKRDFIPQQFWSDGDGTKTDFALSAGYDVWAVYLDGALKREGTDYSVLGNIIKFNTAPAANADVCIMGVNK